MGNKTDKVPGFWSCSSGVDSRYTYDEEINAGRWDRDRWWRGYFLKCGLEKPF